MSSDLWWRIPAGAVAGLVLVYVVLLAALVWERRRGHDVDLGETLRLLPDVLRLLRSLAADPQLPRTVRLRLLLLVVYVASPIDLVPDFIPVLGYVDDAVIIAIGLRSVVRHAGPDAVERHWSGTPAGLRLVLRLAGRVEPR